MHRFILWALFGILFPVLADAQGADFLARQELEGRVTRLLDPQHDDSLARDAVALMVGLGLTLAAPIKPDPAVGTFEPKAGAVIELVDIRLLLTRIAVQAGAQDHAALIRAQGDRDHDVILLRGGFVTLSDLIGLAKGTSAEAFLSQTADGLVLTRPLAIWDDAGLALAAEDTLVLARPSSSFVAGLGRMMVAGGAIRGSAGANREEPAFRPFVLTAGQGSFTALGGRFSALGFDASAVFGGLAVVNSGLVETRLPSFIRYSTISDVASVAMVGTRGSVLAGNRIIGSAGTAVLLSHATDALVTDNRFSGLTGAHAIRVTAKSLAIRISENLLSPGSRIGILVDGDSSLITLSGNVVLGSESSGIAFRTADCITVADNLVAMNQGTGVSLTATDASTVGANAILFNHGSGILLRDQGALASVRVSGNVIAGNREGLRGATAGRVELDGNQLDGQLPRIFAVDLALLAVDWLRHRRDPLPVVQSGPASASCKLGGNG